MSNQFFSLGRRLRGFAEPDTSSFLEGYVEPGLYEMLELRVNFPGPDTDYVHVRTPSVADGSTWLCSRWRNTRYGAVVAAPHAPGVRRNFNDDSAAVEEKAMMEMLLEFIGYEYDLHDARYPRTINSVAGLDLAPPKSNNCCTFVEGLLVNTWAQSNPAFIWTRHRHRQMMVMSLEDPFSPVTAVAEAQMGVLAERPSDPPAPWTIVQGWRRQWEGGHTFLIVDHHPPTDKVLILESNAAFRLNGVGYRGIGELTQDALPPSQWWTIPRVWTWQQVKATYVFLEQAMLAVKGRGMSGIDSL